MVGVTLALTAQGLASVNIAVEHAWARASPKGAPNGVAYLTLINNGTEPDRLLKASSPVVQDIQFHEERTENGISKMRQLDAVELPPGATVTLQQSGLHLMMRLNQQLREGDSFPLTLTFEKAGVVNVTVKIGKVGAMHDMSGMSGM